MKKKLEVCTRLYSNVLRKASIAHEKLIKSLAQTQTLEGKPFIAYRHTRLKRAAVERKALTCLNRAVAICDDVITKIYFVCSDLQLSLQWKLSSGLPSQSGVCILIQF